MSISAADRGFVGHRATHIGAPSRSHLIDGLDLPDWMNLGLCAQTDPEAFYPEKGGSTAEAKKVCLSCTVRLSCLDYALEHQERFGIWGGLSERERRKVKQGQPITPIAPTAQRFCAFSGCDNRIVTEPGHRGRAPKYCTPQHAHYAAMERQRDRRQEAITRIEEQRKDTA